MNLDAKISEESLEELYDEAPCGYLSTRPDGVIARVNRTFLTWSGYGRDELLSGKRFQDLLTIGGKIFYETHFAPLLQMQGFVNEIAFDLACKEGRCLSVLVNAVQTKDASGAPHMNRIILFGAHDRREYERELLHARRNAEQATQAKARLLSMISHDIRTPLSAIHMAAHILESTASPAQAKPIRVLKSSVQNIMELVNDILDYSSIEAGKVSLEEKIFNVREFIGDAILRLESKAEEKHLALRAEVEERVPPYLIGDTVKIGQVLSNLIGNAVKFTQAGSVQLEVRVLETDRDTALIQFRVTDTGIGIAPDRLPHIFDEFTQASSDIAVKYGGTGLGLTISQKLLQLYESDIRVESVLGEGSTFTFDLRLRLGWDGKENP